MALTGEIDLESARVSFLTLGFGRNEGQAGRRTRASLLQDMDTAQRTYLEGWRDWQKELLPLTGANVVPNLYRMGRGDAGQRGQEFPRRPGYAWPFPGVRLTGIRTWVITSSGRAT